MKIEISDRQSAARIDAKALKDMARRLAAIADVHLAAATLILVDDAGIAPINKAAVGHEGATDVITLFYDAIPGDEEGDSAEIILNVERAVSQRPEAPSLELAYYRAHAFDHLAGHDDATPKERTSMHRRERRWLAQIWNAGFTIVNSSEESKQ